ncbi:hypothetical protein VNO77_00280 [Canavalia gladiata]|uniref:Uncharacterized protein n=1 Tax=Canavalia gladiata TaxID=3824 RepID=A0AAN9R953_CANGL
MRIVVATQEGGNPGVHFQNLFGDADLESQAYVGLKLNGATTIRMEGFLYPMIRVCWQIAMRHSFDGQVDGDIGIEQLQFHIEPLNLVLALLCEELTDASIGTSCIGELLYGLKRSECEGL